MPHELNVADIYREDIRDGYALAALEDCMVMGALVEYQDTAYSERMFLWCVPGKEDRLLKSSGPLQEEQTTRKFTVPRQCQHLHDDDPDWIEPDLRKHFPPRNKPSTNAIIHYQGFAWAVSTWESDSVEACFICTAVRHQPRRVEDNE